MKRLILTVMAALLLAGCATMPTMPVRVTAQDSANWHADSLAWVQDVKRIKQDQQLRQVIAVIMVCATLGCYRTLGIPGAF